MLPASQLPTTHVSDLDALTLGTTALAAARKRTCDSAPAEGSSSDEDMECQPRVKRRRMEFGATAAAAMLQWGLDEAAVIAFAKRNGLPGIGITDLLDYRREHPEEDLIASLADADVDA